MSRCNCGHGFEEHSFVVGDIFSCNKCKCQNYVGSVVLQYGETVDDTEERLRAVLRNYYKEFCPNCERHLGIADADFGNEVLESHYRITCQNCFKTVVNLKPKFYRRLSNINSFIDVLKEFPETNNVE